MAEYGSEDDDFARLKDWWRSNGLSLVTGALVGLGAIAGWQGWQMYRDSQAREASATYAELKQALAGGDAKPGEVLPLAERLQSEHGGSPYAAQAGLAVADYFVGREEYGRAVESLQWVVDYAEQPPMRHLARVRQARLLWAQDKPEAALDLLAHDHPPAFTPLYSELAGDIHAAAGNDAEAHQAYRTALDNLPPDADPAPLRRKMDDVSGGAAGGDVEVS